MHSSPLIFARIIMLLLMGLYFSTAEFAFSQSLPNGQTPVDSFYRLLESTVDDPASRILKLNEFIRGHPGFEDAYLSLLESYTASGKSSEAEDYFQTLAQIPGSRQHSCWMLAKIHSRHNKSRAATYYHLALDNNSPSIRLIEDYLKFKREQVKAESDSLALSALWSVALPVPLVSGISNYVNENYAQAIKIFAELWEEVLKHPELLNIYGDCCWQIYDYKQAETISLAGLELSKQLGNLQYRGIFFKRLADIYHKWRQYEQSLSYSDSALTIANRIGDLHLIQLSSGRKATSLTFQENYSDALPFAENAIKIARKLQLDDDLARWYLIYGQALYYLEKFNDALAAYDSCKSKLVAKDESKTLCTVEFLKGDIYKELGQYTLAKRDYENAFDVAVAYKLNKDQYRVRRKLADLLTIEKRYREAINSYLECLNHFVNPVDQCYIRKQIADIYLTEKNYLKAREFYGEALKNAQQENYQSYICWCLLGLSDVDIVLGKDTEALKKLSEALEIAREVATAEKDFSLLIAVKIGFGDAHFAANRLYKAISSYQQAADLIEQSRGNLEVDEFRIGYFGKASQVYKKLVNCYYQGFLADDGKPYLDSLFYYMEMARSRTLKDWKIAEHKTAAASSNSKTYREYRNICNELSIQQRSLRETADRVVSDEELEKQISDLEIKQYSLISQRLRLIKELPEPDAPQRALLQPLPAYLDELQSRGAGLLLYHIDTDISFALAASGDAVKIVPLNVNPFMLDSLIVQLMDPFHSVTNENIREVPFKAHIAYRLYEMLMKPVEDAISLPERLFILPDISLLNLPFEMLLTAMPAKPEYTPLDNAEYAANFLLNRYSVVYSPSIVVLESQPQWVFAKPEILIFANPFDYEPLFTSTPSANDTQTLPGPQLLAEANPASRQRSFSRMRFDPLPYSQNEAQQIRSLCSSARIYQQSDATELSFVREAPKFNIIHLATHGFVDKNFDAFSGVVLAPGKNPKYDGMFMGYEISGLKLHSDLIVLSACETGQGRLVPGEGALGLPRLFLGAGAKTVLMTFWKVDDLFTSQLMPEFYDQFLNQNLSKVDALAEAKRRMLSNMAGKDGIHYQHPLYWASFILYGDPGTTPKYFPLRTFLIITAIALGILATWLFLRRRKYSEQ